MAVQAIELPEGYRYSRADGKESGTRVYLVNSTTGGTCVSEISALGVLPALGEAWEGSGASALYVRGHTLSIVDGGCSTGSARAWRCEVTYSPIDVSSGETEEGVPGFVAYEVDARAELVDTWRVGPFAYLPITASFTATTDVGGYTVDIAGEPRSFPARSATLSVRNVLNGAGLLTATWIAAVGKRNSDTWQAITAGYLVYAGAHVSKIGPDTYTVEHRIVWDAYGHLRQVVAKDPTTGEPYMGWAHPSAGTAQAMSSGALSSPACASYVNWRQPFSENVAFASLGIQT